MVDEEYRLNFKNKESGQEALPSSVAFGSVYIQRKLGLTNRELVEQFAENPYMQHFIGYKEYRSEKPFDPSLLVTFRKRLPKEVMNRIIERSFIKAANKDDKNNDDKGSGNDNSSGNEDSAGKAPKEPPNKGKLIIDATCTPADIAYPTDLELCDKARKWTEVILDRYWRLFGSMNDKNEKPRTYREVARRRFLKLNKRRKKSMKKIQKEIRYQLGSWAVFAGTSTISKNMLLSMVWTACSGSSVTSFLRLSCSMASRRKCWTQRHTGSKTDRIVSLSLPWIRTIVRGKSKAPTEFGAKISISVVNGYTFIDQYSFDAYNEGESSE